MFKVFILFLTHSKAVSVWGLPGPITPTKQTESGKKASYKTRIRIALEKNQQNSLTASNNIESQQMPFSWKNLRCEVAVMDTPSSLFSHQTL